MDNFSSLNDVLFSYYFWIGAIFLSYLVYCIFHSLICDSSYSHTTYKLKGHTWRSIQCSKSIPYNIHCSVCTKLMLPVAGLYCDCCGLSACKLCYRIVDKKTKCKQIVWPLEKPFYHHWVNVGVTHSDSHLTDGLQKFFCNWCQRTKLCQSNLNNEKEVCDFQKYKNIIIPPHCVKLDKNKIISIKPLSDVDWEPIIIFANRKSGSNRSDEVLSIFRGLLNPIQVVDISSTSPESVVRWLPSRCRIIAAGGDGTVAWVNTALMEAPNVTAAVAIMPLGTGNDLSRALGWGQGCSRLDARRILQAVSNAQIQPLDRWKVTITPRRSRLSRSQVKVLYAYNYASIGVDAQVALDFHRARRQFLFRYASRTINYMAYIFLGASRALDDGGCEGLEQRLRVKLDSDRDPLELPPIQALVALNIPSWGAGVQLWQMGNKNEVGEQNVCDRKLEIVGISSSFHIARLQCGLAEPYRFTQASRVEVELRGTCAMQVDGEPWMQGPATITIEHSGQCLMLKGNDSLSD